MKHRNVALVTSARLPDHPPDVETPSLIAALADVGVPATAVPWHERHDWSQHTLAVVRSPWDIYWNFDEFLAWVGATGAETTLLNPPSVLTWNLDKRYLGELASAGVSVVDTAYVEIGSQAGFPDGEFVVKPVISGGARLTARYRAAQAEEARRHIAVIHAAGLAAMVQPYVAEVDVNGERALVYLNGSFDHAIRKGAVLRPDEPFDTGRDAHPHPEAYEPTGDELRLAETALAAVPQAADVLYARVDMVGARGGEPAVMELELIDPWLFLDLSPGSAARYARAIADRL